MPARPPPCCGRSASSPSFDRLDGAELVELLETLEVDLDADPDPEAVLIAEPLAIRARRFRRVLVAGLCEGEFPSQAETGDPFLGEDRRRELALASGLVLRGEPDQLARERYLLYACVSRATERVSFSYRSSDEDGNLVLPSPFLADLDELLDPGWRERRRRRLLADVVWRPEEAPTPRERELALAAGPGRGRRPRRPRVDAPSRRSCDGARPPHPRRVGGGAREVRRLPGGLAGRASARARRSSRPRQSRWRAEVSCIGSSRR